MGAGWTGSNLVATTRDMAEFTHALFSGRGEILRPDTAKQMFPTNACDGKCCPGGECYYGLACFNMSGATGNGDAAYGHLGATYGYDSSAAYFPGVDASIAVASNIETDYQSQPSDVQCLVYNVLL